MSQSNEQVKKRAGRPPKDGRAAQSSAARSRNYRRKKQELAGFGRTEAQAIATILTRIVVATSDKGNLNHDVIQVLSDNIHGIKYIKNELRSGFETLMYKQKLIKSLNIIVERSTDTENQ